MDGLKKGEPLGRVTIPAPASSELTANYAAAPLNLVSESWGLVTYCANPTTGEPVDKPSVTIRDPSEHHSST